MSRAFRSARPRALPAALLAALFVPATRAPARPPDPPHRVVVVSFDGAGAAEYERQRAGLSPDGFRRAEREGVSAARLQTVSPSLTAVVHASLSTGALPEKTGIVSNTYWPAGGPLKVRASGFDAEPDVETLWESLARQGRRVASLAWPGVHGRTPRATTPVGLRWVDLETPGFLWSGPLADTPFPDAAVALPPEARSFSRPRLVRVEPPTGRDGSKEPPLTFVLLDSLDDGRRAYDTLAALDADGAFAGRLRRGDWLALDEPGKGVARRGRWVKLLGLAADASALSLYVGGLGQTEAWPEDFQRTLDKRCGFWPGPPDPRLLEGPEPDTATFLEMAGRFSAFFVSAFEVADRRGDWDVLLAYQPLLDEASHVLSPPPPEWPGFDAARAAEAAAGLREAWRIADGAASRYLRFLDRGGDVILLSDHGLRPVRHAVHPAEVMRRQGWISVDYLAGRPVVRPDSPADVLVSAGSAFVVLNRAGEMPGGVLSPEEAAEVLSDIAGHFRSLFDEWGAPLFATVALRGEAATLGLGHPNAGDLVLFAGPGTTLKSGFPAGGDSAPLLVPAGVAAQHGYGPDPDLDGIFFHAGPGLEATRLPVVRAVEVAARVSARMGLSPPGAK
jgi:hypothetical protein